jgi:hypothetical protein
MEDPSHRSKSNRWRAYRRRHTTPIHSHHCLAHHIVMAADVAPALLLLAASPNRHRRAIFSRRSVTPVETAD